MNRKITTGILLIAVGLLAGCASTRLKHLAPDEFLETAKLIEQPNSALWVRYVGISYTRAYLEYQDMLTLSGQPKTVVFWTNLHDLPEDISQKMRAGESPWKPWQPATNTNERTKAPTVQEKGRVLSTSKHAPHCRGRNCTQGMCSSAFLLPVKPGVRLKK